MQEQNTLHLTFDIWHLCNVFPVSKLRVNWCCRCYLTFNVKKNVLGWYCATCILSSCAQEPPLANSPQLAHGNWENPLFVTRGTSLPATKESLFCHWREPLFYKSGKNDFFCSKKFVMSLFRAIFALGNGREVPNFVLVFPECLRSAFALPSLCLHSGFASGGEEKHKATRQQKHDTNKRPFLRNSRFLASA